eukprot:COSAG01_NODE_43502_length_429_cov_0.848485_2_plen_20_part_01
MMELNDSHMTIIMMKRKTKK